MIDLTLYKSRLDAVAKAQADLATIRKFTNAGGQHRLAISATDGDPAGEVIASMLENDAGYNALLTAMILRAEKKLSIAEKDFLEIAQGDAIARDVEDAA